MFHKIVFEGVKGASYTGDIAIDDVKVMDGSCPLPGDCSFDDGLCTWTNARTGDKFDWIIGGGRTPSFLTGPSKDHTTGSGRFWIILWIPYLSYRLRYLSRLVNIFHFFFIFLQVSTYPQ